jgi:DNA-binding GntR family transcriptional regulator
MVTEIEFTKTMQIYQIRFVIEELAAELAAQNINDEQLSKLKDLVKDARASQRIKSREELLTRDLECRKILYEAANNPMLTEISNTLFGLTLRFHSTILGENDFNKSSQILYSEIEEIHKALSDRDAQKAGKIRRHFLRQYLELTKSKF